MTKIIFAVSLGFFILVSTLATAQTNFTTTPFGSGSTTFGTVGGEFFNGTSQSYGRNTNHYGNWGGQPYMGNTFRSGNTSTTNIMTGDGRTSTCTTTGVGAAAFTNCY